MAHRFPAKRSLVGAKKLGSDLAENFHGVGVRHLVLSDAYIAWRGETAVGRKKDETGMLLAPCVHTPDWTQEIFARRIIVRSPSAGLVYHLGAESCDGANIPIV